jgi:hypothetical protein|tara:strand:+ start:2160 stop:2567 length:408 start_codon:yes stop_codon:yes gene_type:complete
MLRKFIVTLLLITFSGGMAFANWIEFGETDSGVHYIDLNETGSDDKYVYYWVLTNYFNPQEIPLVSKKYSSKKVYKQTDCKRFRTSAVQIILYEKEMSKGVALIDENYKESSFTTPIFESIGFEELEKICSHIEK